MRLVFIKSGALLIIAFLFLLTACRKDNNEIPNIAPAPTDPDKIELLDLINNYRQAGCDCGSDYYPPAPPVTWNDTLEKAAKDHSNDMNANNFFAHEGSDGSDAGDRIDKYNYNWSTYGENIAQGYPTTQSVVEGWINSPGHCANIMNADFKEMGIATSGTYWTQVFAAH